MAVAQTAAEAASALSFGAAVASWLGFDLGLLACAAVGAMVFVLFTASMPRWMALACMVFSVPIGSMIAHAVSVRLFGSGADEMRVLAGVVAAVLAPIARSLVRTVEKRGDGIMDAAADQVADRLKPKGDGQ